MISSPFTQFFNRALVPSLALLAVLSSGCQKNTAKNGGDSLARGANVVLNPRPANPLTEMAQLQRYRGQTAFLNPQTWMSYPGGMPKEEAPQKSPGQDQAGRAEQESDIFKIGKPGSKLLYLLNNYRGLQVVSFADGAEHAQLLGRAAGTGNSPREMYYVEAANRIVAIETEYKYDESDGDYERTNLVVYDVADPAKPRLLETVSVGGYAVDTRIVGDVLYVAARKGKTGFVESFSLVRSKLTPVESRLLSAPVAMNENNMSIQHTVKSVNGKQVDAYYLIATLSESGWGWWDSSSSIEVVDISDPKGHIQGVMSVAAKGVVRERSWTTIKDDTLIVTSNYNRGTVPGQPQTGPARIAVETFRFPGANPEILSADEARYRKLYIARALQGKAGKEYDQLFEKLVSDPELGLRGRFVYASAKSSSNGNSSGDNSGQTSSDGIRKLVDDTIVTVGDGSGLNANLRDVRYVDGLLYAFWVPADNMDPFDLFDVSQPAQGAKYLGRLHFDGWIDRAIPIDFQGHKYVLGLGWVIPVVNDDSGRRQPQAMLFEVSQSSGKWKATDVAQFSFEGSNIWTNFNGQDKMVEVRSREDGTGEILFAVEKFGNGQYASGGQLLSYDLSKLTSGNPGAALKAGAFLSGGSDWIRRAFTNPEIDRVNTFSDRALATFGARSPGNDGTLHAVNVLELARDLVGYATITDASQTPAAVWGVQIISGDSTKESSQDSWSSENATTELRLVRPQFADAEKAAAVGSLTVVGSFIDQVTDAKSGDLLVLTARYQAVKRGDSGTDYKSVVKLSRIGVSGRAFVKRAETEWGLALNGVRLPIAFARSRGISAYLPNGLLPLADGTLLAQVDSKIYRIDTSAGLKSDEVDLSACDAVARENVGVKLSAGRLLLTSSENVESKDYEGLTFTRNFVSRLSLDGAKARCEASVNVPGSVLLFSATGEMLTDDTSVEDIVKMPEQPDTNAPNLPRPGPIPGPIPNPQPAQFDVKTKRALIGLKLDGGLATLKDEAEAGSFSESSAFLISDSKVVRLVSPDPNDDPRLEYLGLSPLAEIERESYVFKLVGKSASLARIDHVPASAPGATDAWYGLVRADDRVQVLRFSLTDKRPVIVPIALVDETGVAQKAAASVRAGSYWSASHFTGELSSYELVMGLSGLRQILLQP